MKKTKPNSRTARPKPQKQPAKRPVVANRRVDEQIRAVLGKHYANKYRVR
jgi:hypothetical protein